MKNEYKRNDIFRCVHESHTGYKNKISVYHILKEKSCFPGGCIYFRWRCKQLNKKSKCHRGYQYVGRKCFGCRDFYEEKIHNYPELQIGENEYQNFLREYEDFEDWLSENKFKQIEIAGKIQGVKPLFIQKIFPKTKYLSFKGFMLIFNGVFIDRVFLDDFVYALVSSKCYKILKFGYLDKIEARAILKIDCGRLILSRLSGIEILERGAPASWDEQSIIMAKETASEFNDQPEGCIQCRYGALVDLQYNGVKHIAQRKKLICLKGISDPKNCYVRSEYCGLDGEAKSYVESMCEKSKKIYSD